MEKDSFVDEEYESSSSDGDGQVNLAKIKKRIKTELSHNTFRGTELPPSLSTPLVNNELLQKIIQVNNAIELSKQGLEDDRKEGNARPWQLTYIELKDRVYKVYDESTLANENLNIDPSEETLIMCMNPSQELVDFLLKKMKINRIAFYETIISSPYDKFRDLKNDQEFYNFVISGDFDNTSDIKISLIRKK